MSTDLSQRTVEIKLGEPTYSAGWEDQVARFVDERRWEIFADAVALLRRPPPPIVDATRWATWERDVLARVSNRHAATLKLITERRGESDVEGEESELLEDYFARRLAGLDYDVDRADVFIPASVAADWYNQVTGDHKKTTGASRTIKQLADEGRLWRLQPTRHTFSRVRGCRWTGKHSAADEKMQLDLLVRLAHKTESTPDKEEF